MMRDEMPDGLASNAGQIAVVSVDINTLANEVIHENHWTQACYMQSLSVCLSVCLSLSLSLSLSFLTAFFPSEPGLASVY